MLTVLVFRVGGKAYGLPLEHVIETMRALPHTQIARTAEPVFGMAIIRGAPTPVLDAGRLLADRATTAQRFVTVRAAARTIALAVDDVVGVRELTDRHAYPVPSVLATPNSALERLGILDGELVAVLRAARLLSEELLATLGPAR